VKHHDLPAGYHETGDGDPADLGSFDDLEHLEDFDLADAWLQANDAAEATTTAPAPTAPSRPRYGCDGLPTEWFFPERVSGEGSARSAERQPRTAPATAERRPRTATDNHGARAKAACAGCEVREACLLAAVDRNEPAGIWGGAGEARRRAVRAVKGEVVAAERALAAAQAEAWDADGTDGGGDAWARRDAASVELERARDRMTRILAAHFRQLDGVALPGDVTLLASFGEGATHGRRSTQAKGCRCDRCCMAASFEGAMKALGVTR
jgi:pyruvate/2-oxoglutarate dehydrogenase complex dihydrolipoamide acyltransferase (E2) component